MGKKVKIVSQDKNFLRPSESFSCIFFGYWKHNGFHWILILFIFSCFSPLYFSDQLIMIWIISGRSVHLHLALFIFKHFVTQFWSLVSLGLCYDFWNKQTHLFLLRFFFFPLWVEWRARLTQTKSRTSIDTFKAERRPGYLDGRQQCNELSRKSDSFATETESAQSTGMRWLTLFYFVCLFSARFGVELIQIKQKK